MIGPMNNYELYKVLEEEYDDPYSEISHYETAAIGPYAVEHVDWHSTMDNIK